MKKAIKILLIVWLLSLCAGMAVFAQSGINVRDIYGTLDPKRDFEPTRISVEDAKYVGIDFITAADTTIMRNCVVILQNDLDFSPLFEIVPFDSFFLRHMEIEQMSILAWKTLGARYVVKLEAEFPRDRIRLRYRLFSTDDGREIRREGFELEKLNYRVLVHEVANDIVKFLTGDEGIYRTKIIFSKQDGEARELYIADYDGYNARPITNNKSVNISPSVTPDGQYVYFTSYMDGRPKIYMLDLKTNEVDLIADYPGINAAPQISPDGKYIACVLSKDGNSEIYLLERNGKIKKRLTYSWAIETSPTWSPNGKEIAFTSDRTGSPQVYIMDAEGLNVRRLTYQGNYNDSPCWSPKADQIIFVTRDGSFKVAATNINGGEYRYLAEIGSNENPHFSPDGYHIVFASNRLSDYDIYTMDIFGNNQYKITNGGGCTNPAWVPEK